MNKFFCFILLIFIALVITYFFCPSEFIDFFKSEWKGSITGIISGAIGGLVTYSYVMQVENKKDEHEKKAKCTNSLLGAQMALSLQMAEVKGIEELANNILNFKLIGNTLEDHFKNTTSESQIALTLIQCIETGHCSINDLLSLTKYLIVNHENNNIISLPYEIFEMGTISLRKKIITPELAVYFQRFSSLKRFKIILEVFYHDHRTFF